MSDEKLVIGMPAGSLADPNRGGNLIGLLKAAGFPTKGYDAGGPTKFPLNSVLMGWDGRPQEFGSQLALGEIDVAIGGDDWMNERILEYKYEYNQEVKLEKVLSLSRGNVRIVIIVNPMAEGQDLDQWLTTLLKEKKLVTMVSEMPYLALDWFHKRIEKLGFKDSHQQWSVQKYRTPPKIDSGIVVYEPWGKTEAKVVNHGVDLGMEITQTGSALRNYGLVIGEDVLRSETGIWANPAVKKNPAKYDLAKMLLLNLYGSIYAENKVLLFFNAKKDAVNSIVDFLSQKNLFADEPTMNEGVNFTEFSVQMDTNSADLPIAMVRYELARLGATGIETVPLDSCIKGIDAIDF
jgi:ATP phosphoribosyltransferase